jgi:uncharacterized protein (DUF1499 family)
VSAKKVVRAHHGGGRGVYVWGSQQWARRKHGETGRTPEYPDLKVKEYSAAPDRVLKGLQASMSSLPRWELVGAGTGPGGGEVQAVHITKVFRFRDDVTVRIRREGGRTKVSVRSRSRLGRLDFGQNARNIRELLAELDRQLGQEPSR